MKTTGMTRPIDTLGRVVIPSEIRASLGIEKKDVLEISVEGNSIILKKSTNTCTFCASTEDLVVFEGKSICKSCLNKLKKEFN